MGQSIPIMVMRERLLGVQKGERAERKDTIRYLDQFRPTEAVDSITDIDFSRYSKQKKVLLLDAEGTFVRHNGWEIDREVIDAIQNSGFEKVAIVTNKKPKNEIDFIRLNWWAHQLGADVVIVPTTPIERKPRPHMIHEAMQLFDVGRNEVLMVGDKLTADIQAANAAGVDSVWIRNRRGEDDLMGDRAVRRPIEKVLYKKIEARPQTSADRQDTLQPLISYESVDEKEENDYPEWYTKMKPELKSLTKIVNLGGPAMRKVEQEEIVEEEVSMDKKLSRLLHGVNEKYGEQFDEIMNKHGRKIATGATLARIPLAFITAGFILADKPKYAIASHVFALSTDGIDGWASRKSEKGPSKDGGKLDQRVDKFYNLTVGLALAVKDNEENLPHFINQFMREVYMNGFARPRAEKEGKDTSAGMSGKISTNMASAAQMAQILRLSESHPVINELLQYSSDAMKWYAAFDEEELWARRLVDQKFAEYATQQMLGLAA